MIAKIEGEKNMVAVEKVGDKIYSMCTLKKDLKVKDVRLAAKSAKETDLSGLVRRRDENKQSEGEDWWRKLVVQNPFFGERKQVSLEFMINTPESEEYSSLEAMLMIGRRPRKWRTSVHLWYLNSVVMIPSSLQIQATRPLPICNSRPQTH